MGDLPPFPTDEVTLAALRHALGASYTCDGTTHRIVGADMNVSQLLNFLSGYDRSRLVPLSADGTWVEYPGTVYSRDDVIRALLDEVERLRSGGG